MTVAKKPIPQPPTEAPARNKRRQPAWLPWLIGGLLVAITLAIFSPVSRFEFVNYDDPDYVTSNAHVLGGLTWANLAWAFATGHASNWHPLTWVSHMLDCQLFGQDAGAHHLVSAAFHALNAALLFLLLKRATGRLWPSAIVAALFAWHSLHVESVAWISERKDLLSALFFLLALLAYRAYVARRGAQAGGSGRRSGAYYGLALLCFALGLMSKPMLVTFPFVLLLVDYWPLGRWGWSQAGQSDPQSPLERARWLLLEKAPFFALSLASSIITFVVQRKGGAVSTSISLPARLENAVVSYARYLGKTFCPNDLSVLYPHPGQWPTWQIIGAAALVLGITGATLVFARRRPYLPVGWFWFLGTLIPVIGLVQVGIQSMADRYTYIPSIGLFAALVWGACDLVPERPGRTQALGLAAVVSLSFCLVTTGKQVQFWHDSERLFRRAVEVTRDNYLAYNNLGFFLSAKGKFDEAMEAYQASLKINPRYEEALNNMGHALAAKKRHSEALPYYEAALKVKPDHVEVHNNLGNSLSELGRIDEAIEHYRFVLQRAPNHADAHNNLGIALAMKGWLDEAIPHFREAIRCKPNYASAHSNLGNALAVQHKLDEAVREYLECLRLNPKDPQAHNNLGNVLFEQGKLDEAVQHYQQALRLNADNPEACYNLGLVLAKQGHREEAVAHFEQALRLKPDYAEPRRQLEALQGKP